MVTDCQLASAALRNAVAIAKVRMSSELLKAEMQARHNFPGAERHQIRTGPAAVEAVLVRGGASWLLCVVGRGFGFVLWSRVNVLVALVLVHRKRMKKPKPFSKD